MAGTLRAWALVWAGWTALALLFGVSTSLTYVSTGRSANWSINLARTFSEWWLWALLTPVVVRLARRFPLNRTGWRRSLVVHVLAGTATAVAKTAADRAIFALITGFWIYWLASTLALQLVVYAGIVAAAHGLEYYGRSREREQLERRLADARLQLLNLQLQPHFLFNTLNAIAELVHEDAEAADRMITALADLLRRSLALGGTQEIPLESELELLGTYLDIQKARFGERLDVRISIADEARSARVPMLLLQPIVENAIKHGLAASLELTVRCDAATLVMEVTDRGTGAADDALRGRAGIGLGNTRERLAAIYGPAASLDLANMPGGGARVTVRLPVRRPEPA
ncbi:MAG: sensor histidine kinase [Vicinamibacterales bacterium]